MYQRTQAIPLRAERIRRGLPLAPLHMGLMVGCSMMVTVMLGSISRADVWVTVDPGGSVTHTRAPAPNARAVRPEVSAQVRGYGNTSNPGFVPRTGPGIALEKQTFGIGLQPHNSIAGTGFYGPNPTYNGVYPPVGQPPVGYYPPQGYYPPGNCPQGYYPQGYYPQGYYPGYYPTPSFNGYPPGTSFQVGSGSATVTYLGSTGYTYIPQPVYPPVVVYTCNVCHRNPCSGHHGGHNHGYGNNGGWHGRGGHNRGVYYNGGGFNETYHNRTVVSPSAGITFGNRGVGISINSGRSTTSTTVITGQVTR